MPLDTRQAMLTAVKLDVVMTTVPEVVGPSDDLKEAGQLLLEHKFGCLPVVDGDILTGIITEADFVRYVCEAM